MKKILLRGLLMLIAANVGAATYEFADNTGSGSATDLSTSAEHPDRFIGKLSSLDFAILNQMRRSFLAKPLSLNAVLGQAVAESDKNSFNGGNRQFACATGCTDDFLITLSNQLNGFATNSAPASYGNVNTGVLAILDLTATNYNAEPTLESNYFLGISNIKTNGSNLGSLDLLTCNESCRQNAMKATNARSTAAVSSADIHQNSGLLPLEWQKLGQAGELDPKPKLDNLLLMAFYLVCALPILAYLYLRKADYLY